MSLVDVITYVSIALMYNLFAHSLASITYKDLQFEAKYENTVAMLVLLGGIGIMMSKIISDKLYKKSVVSKGLFYGGILLLLTVLMANWQTIAEEMKLFMIAGLLAILIWYGYNREKKELDGDMNEKILDDLVDDRNKI